MTHYEGTNKQSDYEDRMLQRRLELVTKALELVFDFGKHDAENEAIKALDRLSGPYLKIEQIHLGALHLAAEIARIPLNSVQDDKKSEEKIVRYFAEVKRIQNEAAADYAAHGVGEERAARIRERAHRLWVRAGHLEGKRDEYWFEAEKEIDAEMHIRRPAGEQASEGRGH